MIRILPSHPDYQIYNNLWNLYAIAKNPQMWAHEMDLETHEHQELLETLEGHMQDLIGGLHPVFLEAVLNNKEM